MKTAVLSLLPIGLGGIALARTLAEHAAAGLRGRGTSHPPAAGRSVADIVAALTALALYVLSLEAPGDDEARARLVLSAALAGALWLAGRASDDGRLRPLFLLTAGFIGGVEASFAVAVLPLIATTVADAWARARGLSGLRPRLRVLAGALLVCGAGGLIGAWTSTAIPLRSGWRVGHLLDVAGAIGWLASAAHASGVAGVAFGLAGLTLGVLRGTPRRRLATFGLLIVGGEIVRGVAGPPSAVGLALGAGLFLLDAGERLAAAGLRGSTLALAPLVVLALVEPLSVRAGALQLRAPDLGPVPPRDGLALPSGRSRSFAPKR